ncbi:MAG: MATE family efflux transporter [Bacteroidales bacterium]|jgi:MATE family multidrug resistance protein|nr:MATE family efflux transporter [Bacteroidales bacterium]
MQIKITLRAKLMKKNEIIRLAIPNIISNVTIPLLGMIDLAIVGHMGDKSYIGAVAIGTTIFNFIYWNFGFLRMGTSGFAAQAYGKRDFSDTMLVLARSVLVGFTISVALILCQHPIGKLAFFFIKPSETVAPLAWKYFSILIWAAPATLELYSLKGWFIGMQNSKTPMVIAILINVLNICFSLLFVYAFGMTIEGVAWGSVLAQYSGLALAIFMLNKNYKKLFPRLRLKKVFLMQEMLKFFSVNGNIFLRTLCMIAVFTFFTSASSRMGDTLLAVNTLLMQLFMLFSYIMDGFAYAAEALAGKYFGAKNLLLLKRTIKDLMKWGVVLSLIFTVLYLLFGSQILAILTNEKEVLAVAKDYIWWVLPVPLVGFSAFLWDGIFIGTSAAKAMRNAIFVATAIFFTVFYTLYPHLGIHALWIAFLSFLLLRGILQQIQAKRELYDKITPSAS